MAVAPLLTIGIDDFSFDECFGEAGADASVPSCARKQQQEQEQQEQEQEEEQQQEEQQHQYQDDELGIFCLGEPSPISILEDLCLSFDPSFASGSPSLPPPRSSGIAIPDTIPEDSAVHSPLREPSTFLVARTFLDKHSRTARRSPTATPPPTPARLSVHVSATPHPKRVRWCPTTLDSAV